MITHWQIIHKLARETKSDFFGVGILCQECIVISLSPAQPFAASSEGQSRHKNDIYLTDIRKRILDRRDTKSSAVNSGF
jgi:hypothetical protein